jgi:hypothetical protein
MQEQNYKNHSRISPVFHIGFSLFILIILGAGIYKFIRNYQMGFGGLLLPSILILLTIAVGMAGFLARSFALKAQDRAIRAEENLRYFAITGKLLDSKLRLGQIIALRFAPNNEFVDLAHRAVNENLSPKQIKQAIVHWRGDHHRV